MQLGGVGHSHNTDTHQVTQCLHHDHSVTEKESGAAAKLSAAKAGLQTQKAEQQMFSLTDWAQKLFERGRYVLRGIWGNGDGGSGAAAGDRPAIDGTGSGRGSAAVGGERSVTTDPRTAMQIEAAQVNPYFSIPADNGTVHVTPFQKVRAKVKEVAGHLAGHLPGKFFKPQAQSSFQTKQERPKEDLRRHSKYRKDEVEIDCILTDESYLLDSYDRTGGYSKLSVHSGKAGGRKQ